MIGEQRAKSGEIVIAVIFLIALSLPSLAMAQLSCEPPSRDTRTWYNPTPGVEPATITFSTPETYPNCPWEGCCDVIYTEGVPGTWRLVGFVQVQFVLPDGTRTVVETLPVNQSGDLYLEVCYPPLNEWASGEIHVDLAIYVVDAAGSVAGWVGGDQAYAPGALGPGGQDWDVFCSDLPEGCTPGYWKNHLDSWAATGYSPEDDFDRTFGVNLFSRDITLKQAVNAKGGGVNKLARHGTAALLNAASPDVEYFLTVDEVITAVQTGDADSLARYNEFYCPLD